MELSDEAIKELVEVHKQQTGEDLSFDEAAKMAEDLFRLVQAVAKPFPKRLLEEQKEEFPELYREFFGESEPSK